MTINPVSKTVSKGPLQPKVGQNLQPFTGKGGVSIGMKNS